MKTRLSIMISNIEGFTSAYVFALAGRPSRVVAQLRLETDEGAAFVRSLYVEPRYCGAGLGSQMLERAFSIAREQGFETIGLHVSTTNERAAALYARLGFRKYLNAYNEGYKQLVKIL